MTSENTPALPMDSDAARLTELVAVVQRTQRSEDVEGFLALFAQDAVWVNGAGHRLVGLDEIATFTRRSLPGGLAGQSVRYDVVDVRFLASDVAITSVDQEYLTAEEQSFSPRRQGKPTYVWARRDGNWQIVQGQNTTVVPPDTDSDKTQLTPYRQYELAAQPIGFWSGEAYRRISAAIRKSLASNNLTQPQWWTLGRLDDDSRVWTRESLINELTPYSAAEEGRDVGDELDGLVRLGWAVATDDVLAITSHGRTRLRRAQQNNQAMHDQTRQDISDAEYAAVIDALRRMVGNLGGDAHLR